MKTTMAASVPLEAELQNALTLVLTVALLLLFNRMIIMSQDIHFMQVALTKNYVAYVPQLGPSLDLLEAMPMEHLQQFLRQQDQISRVAMETINVPFDLVGKSVQYAAGSDTDTKSLSFDIQSTLASCSVQVLWDVDAVAAVEALSHSRSILAHPSPSPKHRFPRSLSSFLRNTWRNRSRSSTSSEADLRPLQGATTPSSSRSVLDLNAALDLDDLTLPCQLKTDPCILEASQKPSPSGARLFHFSNASLPRPTSSGAAAAVIVVRTCTPSIQVVVHSPSSPSAPSIITTAFFVLDLTAAASPIKQRLFSTDTMLIAHEIYGADDFVECSICLEDPTNVIVLPCRHRCICSTCLAEIDACPICRAKFAAYVTSS